MSEYTLGPGIQLGLINIYETLDQSVLSKLYERTEALNTWMIQHDLGYDPAGVVVLDELGNQHWPLISYPVPNQVIQLDFETPIRGICRLS